MHAKAWLSVVLVALACGGPTEPGVPLLLNVLSGGDQAVTVGSHVPQPIVFQAENRGGTPLHAQVSFTLRSISCGISNGINCDATTAGDDQLANPTLTTGPDGIASFTGWTLGTKISAIKCLAAYQGTNQPKGITDIGLGIVCVTPLPGLPAQLIKVSTDNQQAPAGSTLVGMRVQVLDQYGNSLGRIMVSSNTWVGGRQVQVAFTPSADGTVSQAQVTTDTGDAAVDWTIAAGANVLTITVVNLSVTYSATGL